MVNFNPKFTLIKTTNKFDLVQTTHDFCSHHIICYWSAGGAGTTKRYASHTLRIAGIILPEFLMLLG